MTRERGERRSVRKCVITVDMTLAMAEPRYAQKKAAEEEKKYSVR